jgi:hypothetical protein
VLQSVPQLARAKPRLLVTLKCLSPIIVQVIGPNTLYLAETDNALMQTDESGLIDAVQINRASGLVLLWWLGDVWAAGSVPFKPLIIIPDVNTGSGLIGGPGGTLGNTLGGVI